MKMKINFLLLSFAIAMLMADANAQNLTAPPQTYGLPYTTSSKKAALEKVADFFCVYPGSRYGLVKGYKVRLDDVNWRDEAVIQNKVLYVPASFAGLLFQKEIKHDAPPAYLVDKWVYTVSGTTAQFGQIKPIMFNGRPYYSFEQVALQAGLTVFKDSTGLMVAGNKLINFKNDERPLLLSIITMFDSPEKLANPDIATQYIPSLKLQGKWTDHVKVTPEQMKVLEGPETKWEFTPKSAYNFAGFNKGLLGSAVPKPGVYPRILFSPEDVPMLAARINSSQSGKMSMIEVGYLMRKSFWDPTTSDGKVFQKLVNGDLQGLEWPALPPDAAISTIPQMFKGETAAIYNSHVAYLPECLTDMALYCLLTNDDIHGRQAAAAIANYFKLREPLIDEYNSVSDSEFGTGYTRPDGAPSYVGGGGANTAWRNIHGLVAHMNLGLSLDFAGKWMTPEEKDLMRRVIAKATYGRRGYGQDGSVRFRDINWVAWDLPNFLALAAIEGLEGFDKEAYQSNCETVKAFAEWGIDPNGVVYESNGKTPGGMQFFILSMITLARRGDNLWGHPHVRKLMEGQTQMTSPDGKVVVNSGTQYVPYSQQTFSLQAVEEFKAFYPNSLIPDYLLSQSAHFEDKDEYYREWKFNNFDALAYQLQVAKVPRLRMPSPTYPGFVHSLLYNTDYKPTTRAELNLPLVFNAPVHGVFSAYSDASTQATWINMMVRPDHYLGAGHHHADAGMFHFSALGVNWITESTFPQVFAGKFHNEVLVDGRAEPDGLSPKGVSTLGTGYQAAATYLGDTTTNSGGFATADLTMSYTYRWLTQPPPMWDDSLKSLPWELDPSPQIMKTFAGTARYKMRPWWPTYTYSNYIATSRAPYNPMEYVFRSVGLVRGNHPYGLILDDLKKDNAEHLFQWTAMLNGGVWKANINGLAKNQMVLGYKALAPNAIVNNGEVKPAYQPKVGDPLVLVTVFGVDLAKEMNAISVDMLAGPNNAAMTKEKYYDQLTISNKTKIANYRVLLIPFTFGQPLPTIVYNAGAVTLKWVDQSDSLVFTIEGNRTAAKVYRDGQEICFSK